MDSPAASRDASAAASWAELVAIGRQGRATGVLATVGINLAALALPIFILQIYDRVLPNESGTTLLVLVAGLLVAVGIEASLRIMRSRHASWRGARLEHVLRVRAVARLLGTPLPVFGAREAGGYLEAIAAGTTLRDFEVSQKQEVAVDLLFATSYLALIAYLGGLLVLVPIGLLTAFALLALGIGRALHAAVTQRIAADEHRQGALLRTLGGLLTVKALALNQVMQRRHEADQEACSAAVHRVMLRQSWNQVLGAVFAQANTIALLAIGALLVLRNELSLGGLAACTLLAGRAMGPIQAALGLWSNYQGISVARRELRGLMALPQERRDEAPDFTLAGAVRLEGVSVRYAPGAPLVLDGLDLDVEAGRVVGIEAAAGAGKTTLLRAILGLVGFEAGRIVIDGRPLDQLPLGGLRRQCAYLVANGPLFSGSVIDNLTNFREGECVNEALYLSFLLGLDEPIRRLPNGFDYVIEADETLPSGLAQGLAMVRELVNGPRLVLFDDADRHFDHDGRQRLVSFLRGVAGKATLILVSDRPEILALAERRYRLSGGRLHPAGADAAPVPDAAR